VRKQVIVKTAKLTSLQRKEET